MLVFASLRNKKSIVFAFGKHLGRCQKLLVDDFLL